MFCGYKLSKFSAFSNESMLFSVSYMSDCSYIDQPMNWDYDSTETGEFGKLTRNKSWLKITHPLIANLKFEMNLGSKLSMG